MTSPWSNQGISLIVVQASTGGFTGFFMYSPTPGAGNLIASITPSGGTDPYGNTYPKGISSTDGSIEAIMVGKQLGWDAPADHPFTLPAMFATPSGTNGNQIEITTGEGKNTGTAGALTLYDSNASSVVPAIPSGSPGIFVAQGCPMVTDTWHSMPSMSAGWTVGGHASYRLTPLGDLQVAFKDLVPSTDTDGTVIWAAGSLPASYRVANNHRVVAYAQQQRTSGTTSESAALEFETDGSIQCYGVAAASTRLDLYATIPLNDS